MAEDENNKKPNYKKLAFGAFVGSVPLWVTIIWLLIAIGVGVYTYFEYYHGRG